MPGLAEETTLLKDVKTGRAIPLEGVSVSAEIVEGSVRTVVSHRFANRGSAPVEAVYVFPLDEGAAVCAFEAAAADLGGDYPAVEYTPPHGRYSMDILSRLGEAFRFEEIEAQDVDVEGVRARVATPRMLYLMKKDTVRSQDRIDAMKLRERFGLKEE